MSVHGFANRTTQSVVCARQQSNPRARRGMLSASVVVDKSLAGQAVGVKEVDNGIWLVSFMDYDLGYVDLEEKQSVTYVFGTKCYLCVRSESNKVIVAEREGFEPSIEFPLYTLSKRAPSTARPSLL